MRRSNRSKSFFRLVGIRCAVVWLAFVAMAVGLAGCQASLVPARQGLLMRNIDLPVRQLTFPSGLRVVAERDGRNKVAGLFLVVGAGSSSDPIGKEGLAHYVEHLTFRSRPYSKSSFRRLLERADAGEWNAYTSLDATVYHEVGPASDLPELLHLEGARMLAPVANVTPETLAVELDVVRSELRERNETGFVGEALGSLQKAVFPAGHPYARPVSGTHESLTSIQVEDVRDFLRSHYEPSNMTLAIVGDIDLATIEDVVRQALPPDLLRARSFKPRVPLPERAPEPPNPPPQVLSRTEASVATPEIWIGWSLPRGFDADIHLVGMVEDAARSVLAWSQVQSNGSYGDRDIAFVDTQLVPGKDASMLVCRVALHEGTHPEKSLEHVLNYIHRVWNTQQGAAASQVGEILFGSRQREAVVNMLLETENLVQHGTARALTTHFTQNPLTYTRSFEKVVALKQEPFIDYAQKYLARERARAVFFSPSPGGALAKARPIGAHQLGEEDLSPVRVDEARLSSLAPSPAVGQYRQFSLANGLQVILGRRDGSPSVAVDLVVRGGFGAASDAAAAHVAVQIARAPRWNVHGAPFEFGARSLRRADEDAIAYAIEGAAGNTGMMIAIMAETARALDVDADAWRDFRKYFTPYLHLAEQKPETVANRAFVGSLFAGHPYGRSPTADDLANSSGGAAQEWLDTTHTASNSALIIVGEIDPAEVEKVVRAEFDNWKTGAASPAPPSYEPVRGARDAAATKLLVTARPGATQTQIHLGCNLPAAKTAADGVRNDVAAQLVESRLSEALRERTGVTYGIRARSRLLRGGTAFLDVQGAVERDKLSIALKTVREELRTLGEAPPSDNDLAWAKLRAARARTTAYLTNHDVAYAILRTVNLGYPVASLDGAAKDIAAATAKDVAGDVRACTAGGLTLSLVGDEPSIRAALKEAGL